MKRLLILMDWKPPANWAMKQELSKEFEVTIFYKEIPAIFKSKIEKLIRFWSAYVANSLRAFLSINKFDIVFAWQPVMGLVLAFALRLLRRSNVHIVISQFIFPQKAKSTSQRLRQIFINFAMGRIGTVIVHSRVEKEIFAERYSNFSAQFVFVPLGIDVVQQYESIDKGYIFSGGRSNRDYGSLVKASQELDCTILILAQGVILQNSSQDSNVKVLDNVFGQEFDKLIAESSFVVIPLDRADESSGQLVLLKAMTYGKAVVVTENNGVNDYIVKSETAISVPPKDIIALRSALECLIEDKTLCKKLGKAGQRHVCQFRFENYAVRIKAILIGESIKTTTMNNSC